MAYTNGIELENITIEFGTIYTRGAGGADGGAAGAFSDSIDISPTIETGSNYVAEGAGVFTSSVDLEANIELGATYPIPPPLDGVFDLSAIINAYALPDGALDDSKIIEVGTIIDWSGAPRSGRAPLEVVFTDLCSPIIETWLWDFGDGEQSIAQHPTHTYRFPGIYDVNLTVTIGSNTYSLPRRRYITVWPGGIRVARTNICWRYAYKVEQGVGWTKYTGGWIFPESRVGTMKILDSNNQTAWLMLDTARGLPYVMANRNGPSGSNITREFRDRVTSYGGQEIACVILLKEHTGKKEKPLQHDISLMFIRPYDENNKGASGYLASGQRAAQQVDVKAYLDGAVAEVAEARDIPVDGEVAFDKKTEADRIQIEYDLAASEFKVVGFSQSYLYRDRKGVPSQIVTTEQDYHNEFGLPIVWLSRGPNLLMNRATGTALSGSIFAATTGPDSKTQSGMTFSTTTGLTGSTSNFTSNFSIIFSAASLSSTTTILSLATGGASIQITIAGSTRSLRYVDSANDVSQDLSWDGTGWITLKIIRSGLSLMIAKNGAHLQTFTLSSVVSIGGSMEIMNAQIGSLFDIRLLASAASDAAFLYYYTDLTNNNGNSFLPMW